MLGIASLSSATSSENPAAPATADLLEKAYALDAAKETSRDLAAAIALYRQAAAAGDAHAHLRLGHLSEVGDGVLQDYAAARAHYQAAVDLGLHAARVPLAICHLEGWGGPVSREEFIREIRAAAEGGDNAARKILGAAYAAGIGVPRDYEQANAWLKAAALDDDAEAQHDIGNNVERAQRFATSVNTEIARSWYQLSAEQEYATAMRAMARSFIASAEAADWGKFREWLELAIESGDSEAPFTLAAAEMLRPDMTSRDERQARAWIALAAERGHLRAVETLDFMQTGWTLEQTLRYVLTESQDERYVRRVRGMAGSGPNRIPVPIKTVTPIYPLTFRAAGISGSATVVFVVDTAGRVQDVTAPETTHPVFAERSIAAIREWRFEPAMKDNRRVQARVQITFPFSIQREVVDGVDGLLVGARSKAQELGPEYEKDAEGLRLAKPKGAIDFPTGGRAEANERRYAIVILVLDETGRPTRGRILEASPGELGEQWLQIGLRTLFEPRFEDGKRVPSNVLLPFFSEFMQEPLKP